MLSLYQRAVRRPMSALAQRSLFGRSALLYSLVFCLMLLGMPGSAAFAQSGAVKQDSPLVVETFQYQIDVASEVFLVWGINGWNTVPQETQPIPTIERKGLMYTPMTLVNGTFETKIKVPLGVKVDYVFQITKTRTGNTINIWDSNGVPNKDYHTYAVGNDGVAKVESSYDIKNQVDPEAMRAQIMWYAIYIVFGLGLIVGFLLLRRRMRNPFLNY